jgi:hypothetical protein
MGKLSSYYVRKRSRELANRLNEETPLLAHGRHLELPVTDRALKMMFRRIIMRAQLRGKRFDLSGTVRYEVHGHALRKFGITEMEGHDINSHVIEFLAGKKTDTYSKWVHKYDELREIYIKGMPRLTTEDRRLAVVDYAESMGFTLDPETLKRREIQASRECCGACPQTAEATRRVKGNEITDDISMKTVFPLPFPPLFSEVSNSASQGGH